MKKSLIWSALAVCIFAKVSLINVVSYADWPTTTTTTYLRDCMLIIEVSPPEGGTTSPPPGSHFIQGCSPENWSICAKANNGYIFSHWDGECSGSIEPCCSASFRDKGYISVTAIFNVCPSEEIYGEHSEQTELLRYFRDNVLSQTPEGQELIKLYYQWSPTIVEMMEEDEGFKEEVKGIIDGVLIMLEEK